MARKKEVNQSIVKQFSEYISLGVLSMLGMSLFILADTFFIANGIGADGIAALNIVLPIVNIVNGLGWMLGVGGATLFSLSKGRNEIGKAKQQFTYTFVCSVIIAFIIWGVFLVFSDYILRILGASGHIFGMSKSYYMVLVSFSPAFVLNNVMITFLRNDNNPRLAMIGLLTGGLINIVLDYLFIFPFEMGLRGAAIATVISPMVSLAILTIHFKSEKRSLAFTSFSRGFKEIRQIVSLGFSSFLNEFSSAVVMFLFNIFILQLVGNIGVSAYGIIANMNIIAIAIFTGMGQGFQPLISHYYGLKDLKSVRKLLKYGVWTSFVLGLFFFLIGYVYSDFIVIAFNSEQNQILADIAEKGLVLYFISFLFTGINFILIYFMAAIGKARPSFIISLLRGLILIIPILLIMSKAIGLTGIWLTMPIVECMTFLIGVSILYRYINQRLKTE
ncbi:MATE family efflux transporter [Amphibacillus sp. Q70]|uniref:MATE family efflux transporter n=1 Tax=Amphibacillus sp. Q70 TaxID=3453416 RepID=UPI003F8258FD